MSKANEQMIAERDRRMNPSSSELRQRRADIPYPQIDPEADAWSKGIVLQLRVEQRAEPRPQ